jgi:hypothetical protein
MRLEGAVSLELLIVSISLNSFKTLSIEIGLPKIREKCRGFNAWLAHLESL